jgi:gliding motility associated protien GldN
MKKVMNIKATWLLAATLMLGGSVFAQVNTRLRKSTPQTNQVVNPATGNAVTPPAPPPQGTYTGNVTPQGVGQVSLRADNVFGIDSVRPSLRNDMAVPLDTNDFRTPLTYQYIRPDDAMWGKRVWAVIDTRQKMNLPFRYPGYDQNGNSMTLINIILQAILKDSVVAFSPIDDRFTTPLSTEQVGQLIHGKPYTIRITDPVTGLEHDTTISNDFDPNAVQRYELKEDWVFDKGTSTLYCRIIGLAPLQTIYNQDGSVRTANAPMFWLYYPDMRAVLARYNVFNARNFYQHMSWEDLFEERFFSSYIIKEDNPLDRSIKDMIPGNTLEDGVKRLLEGRAVRNQIFNYEQNLWSY